MDEGEMAAGKAARRTTMEVSEGVFRQVYDSPASLPGKEKWVTSETDVREVETLLGMAPRTIGAPLWLSGDTRHCRRCGRETSWLDIVSSALQEVHAKELIAEVILGSRRFINMEAPQAIAGLRCHGCGDPITDLRSFKCHNWAYAHGDLVKVIEHMRGSSSGA